jgi:hypothetical protein
MAHHRVLIFLSNDEQAHHDIPLQARKQKP